MTTRTIAALFAILAGACATANSAERQPASAAVQPIRVPFVVAPTAPAQAPVASAVTPGATVYIAAVDDRGDCEGALCLTIHNTTPNPALLRINGHDVFLDGGAGPMLLADAKAYVQLLDPGRVIIEYDLYDQRSAGATYGGIPMPTVLARCKIQGDVGNVSDIRYGGRTIDLSASGLWCRTGR